MKSALITTALLGLIPSIQGLAVRDAKSGCNQRRITDTNPESVNLTLPSASGVTPRKYRLHLPPGYDGTKELPLILSYHGRTQDALYQENLSQFSNASYGFEGIAVYPEGVPLIKVRQTNSINLVK
jgi:poly(3-hydroxybutyrate) depolymerase